MIYRFMCGLLILMFSVTASLAADPPGSATGTGAAGSKNTANVAGKSDQALESCVATAKGPIESKQQLSKVVQMEAQAPPTSSMARVGKPAPDFEANAFQNGKFRNIKLSDYKGRWVVLCFYPGDFTFV